MEKNPDGTFTIQWYGGVNNIAHERKIDGRDIVFGYRLNGGEFEETSRLRFASESDLKSAMPTLLSLGA